MKQLLSIIFVAAIFIGCTPKQEVEINIPQKEVSEQLGKPITNDFELGQNVGEQIEGVDPLVIEENEFTLEASQKSVNVAIVYPSRVVGRYAKSSMNTILGYLSFMNASYNVKVYDTENENPENITKAFEDLKTDGYEKVIALFTPRAASTLHTLDSSSLSVFLPLSNKGDYETYNDNFVYGAISYDKQIQKLLEYSNIKNTMFYQESYIGKKLKEKYEKQVPSTVTTKLIKNKRNYFKWIVKDHKLNNSTLFLNTKIVKTSIILSQLRAYETKPKVILSTQLNFNPKIIALTQEKDRKNLVVASSIDKVDDKLIDTIKMYGGDIEYNWVDYSTLVGIHYLFESNQSNGINTKIEDNRVIYEPKLYKTTRFGFLEIK
ncbi:hypothetical protein [Arcobacter roscoffensis]|uniref:Uncharacterized protein n=1 Tax=Arcobacter roscoffensis TaxID=2961520 RepID=A0ABY5E5I6_9BACT|nr:hypothetical protein [Arcobacter roscoffensis]UTJ07414.1 hypothetical protein NJU99_04790 [Arcobacter roscoffensis]